MKPRKPHVDSAAIDRRRVAGAKAAGGARTEIRTGRARRLREIVNGNPKGGPPRGR